MEGGVCIGAKGLGVILRKPFLATESPLFSADNFVEGED
tara:strand:- start:167 stop:283 length:117 start_codon:yes stop_codon:yes gene_type:complete